MRKRLKLAASIGLMLTAFTAVTPAMAASNLADCISEETVCISSGASIGNASEVSKYMNGKAKVAVVPYDEANSLDSSGLATNLAQESGVSELIVIIDLSSDRFGVYSESGKAAEVTKNLNATGETDGGQAIMTAQIADIYASSADESSNTEAFVFGGSAILLTAVISVVAVVFIRRSLSSKKADKLELNSGMSPKKQKTVEITDDLRRELSKVTEIIRDYQQSNKSPLQEAAVVLGYIHQHIYELFSRIDKKKAGNSRAIAQVRYLNAFKKLNEVAGKDYFADIVNNPNLWDDSELKVAETLKAIKSLDKQIIDNIRQVNNSKEIDFKIAVDTLMGPQSIEVEEAFGKTKDTMDSSIHKKWN